MSLKKFIIFIVFFLTAIQAIAKEDNTKDDAKEDNKIGLNFFYNIGFSLYQNLQINNIKFEKPSGIRIFDFQFGVLYELNKLATGNVLIGAGLNTNMIYYNDDTVILGKSYNSKLLGASIGGKVYIGYKIIPSDRFAIHALGTYGFYLIEENFISSSSSSSSAIPQEHLKIENHVNYGVNLINTYYLTNNFGVSLSLGANINSMDIKNTNFNINQKSNYTDVIIALGLMYSI